MSDADPDLVELLQEVNGIGPSTAEVIAEAFDDREELADTVTDIATGYSPVRLSRLEGFGPERARKLAINIDESGVLETPTRLWGDPTTANKTHIIGDDGRSLCGKYGLFPTGRGVPVEADDVYDESEHCKACANACELVTVATDDQEAGDA